jgi:stearoyl-CoA desaturase (delta-9 desaturase)
MSPTTSIEADRRLSPKAVPFFLFHLVAVVAVAWSGWSWKGLLLALAVYYVRMFGVTAGYHRYFAHRSFRTSRAMQLVFALLATSSAQKGVIWWAAHHRMHHKFSDLPGDVHSVKLDGFLWSHVGWIVTRQHEGTDTKWVKDLIAFPELRFLDKYYLTAPIALSVGLFLAGGWWALTWGLFVSTVLLWHGTFTINSLTHMFGSRRYTTGDNSRNSFILAIVTMGEGWHNNHHYYQRAVNQGFFWWEIDPTYYILRALAAVGLVWDLHTPPAHIRDAYLAKPSSAGESKQAGEADPAEPTIETAA